MEKNILPSLLLMLGRKKAEFDPIQDIPLVLPQVIKTEAEQ